MTFVLLRGRARMDGVLLRASGRRFSERYAAPLGSLRSTLSTLSLSLLRLGSLPPALIVK